ncbi:unnamed protein product [Chilo suppressalis]|uniref:FLYWCH-type domain-containing protein n=1 Tax=Chilo suppressalis TaxID=168631 RepID=A0ABN8AT59_CHISP|nr:unnamed protein product [Chilo suppressalis]
MVLLAEKKRLQSEDHIWFGRYNSQEFIYIPAGHKKNLIMFRGYTFSTYGKNLWYCSKIKFGCKAKLKLDDKERIIYARDIHCHEPPEYCVTSSGKYILVHTVYVKSDTGKISYIIIPSQRGGKAMLYNGFRFNVKRENKHGNTVWCCAKKHICKGSVITCGDTVIVKETKHTCQPDETVNQIKLMLQRCIAKCEADFRPVKSIYDAEVEEFKQTHTDIEAKIPKFDSVKKILYKYRNKALEDSGRKLKQYI